VIKRERGYLYPRNSCDPSSGSSNVPNESIQLESQGHCVVHDVLSTVSIQALRQEIDEVYETIPPDGRGASYRNDEVDREFRYEMFNRSALCQKVVAHPAILQVIEPLLGDDCHIIANTCWRNPATADGRAYESHGGGFWHIDAGPHLPRNADQPWPSHLPYPVFAIGVHIYLQDCPLACGPTGVIPGSHTSGQVPPAEHRDDIELCWNGRGVTPLTAKAGDVAMFVSDVWHRRLPSLDGDAGRFFLQVHYGRRDIAQRLHTTDKSNQLSDAAQARIQTKREAQLFGLHAPLFYDG
jgi:ectoine hydroxylase-related dioxygenase (phytanoyl-CoA dioxygenase family)